MPCFAQSQIGGTSRIGGQSLISSQAVFANCPTGQQCGVNSTYCNNYTPPSTSGATLISSLPIKITTSGNYYLNSDLSTSSSPWLGISVQVSSVDINLNGHTITYGTTANGTGSSQIGEYGILICDTGNISQEALDSSFSTNGYCKSGGLAASSVTIENGTITQSTNASGYTVPNLCPGSGVSCSTAVDWPTTYSHAIFSANNTALAVKHVSITYQNVGSEGIVEIGRASGTGYDFECNTINDKVTVLNQRAASYGHGAIYTAQDGSATQAGLIQYNTIIGSPQNGIVVAGGGKDPTATLVQYNDVNVGYWQMPPNVTTGEMYSNDYAIGYCGAGSAQYNYVHNVNGRGLTCIYDQGTGIDLTQGQFSNNYVVSVENPVNGEYVSPNGTTPGDPWVGGCEINGGRGLEFKRAYDGVIQNNTLIIDVPSGSCGGAGIDFTNYYPTAIPTTAPHPININHNLIEVVNQTGGTVGSSAYPSVCYNLDTVQGNYGSPGPFFQPIVSDTCITDGNFAHSDGFNPGDYFTWVSPTFQIGSHPFTTDCSEYSGSNCGMLFEWVGQTTPPPDELGFSVTDITLNNGACPTFDSCIEQRGTVLARGGTILWTITFTLIGNTSSNPVSGAVITGTDANAGYTPGSCTTNSSGTCSLILRQVLRGSAAGSALSDTTGNPNVISFNFSGASPSGCSLANQNYTASATASQTYHPTGC